jgi:hypothetical protein
LQLFYSLNCNFSGLNLPEWSTLWCLLCVDAHPPANSATAFSITTLRTILSTTTLSIMTFSITIR